MLLELAEFALDTVAILVGVSVTFVQRMPLSKLLKLRENSNCSRRNVLIPRNILLFHMVDAIRCAAGRLKG